jgi:hypothetical protein
MVINASCQLPRAGAGALAGGGGVRRVAQFENGRAVHAVVEI